MEHSVARVASAYGVDVELVLLPEQVILTDRAISGSAGATSDALNAGVAIALMSLVASASIHAP